MTIKNKKSWVYINGGSNKMNMQEFREYVTRQRRQLDDQRNPTKDDQRKCNDVATNKQNESLHGNYKSGTNLEV